MKRKSQSPRITLCEKLVIAVVCCLILGMPLARADDGTAQDAGVWLGSVLVTKTLEPVGIVNVWNTLDELNIDVIPDSGFLLSKVYVYLNTELAPPPVPDGLEDWVKEAEELWLECVEPEEYCDVLQEEYLEILEEYKAWYVEPDFGEWPFGATFKPPTADPYSLTIFLSLIDRLQWEQWEETWLPEQLVTIAVRVELRGNLPYPDYKAPDAITAWAINPNVPIEGQRAGWGDNAYAMQFELQFP